LAIFEPSILKDIMTVTCSILKRNFFYEDESLVDFLDNFTEILGLELDFFEANAKESVIDDLYNDIGARAHFTCYFTSAHLREYFIQEMFFTEQELYAFENILPKYTGERYEKRKTRFERAHDRKFFK
jgi:hypothetical protein